MSHELSTLLFISVCAMLSGADDFEEISEFGNSNINFLSSIVPLPNGIPSSGTFRRVFQSLDTVSFERCLRSHTESIIKSVEGLQVNMDGKVLRGTGVRGEKTAAQCIVSAWISEECLCLGQVKVDQKSNEKTALPELIETVELKGALVSIDAMGCHNHIAGLIRKSGGDYLLALKQNQKGLYQEVNDWMLPRLEQMDSCKQTDYGGGRIEARTTYVSHLLNFVDELSDWPDCKSLVMVETQRSFKNGEEKNTCQRRFYISSQRQGADYFARSVRKHWSIENQLHWHLDVTFREDRQRVEQGNAPENMAVLRKLALQALLRKKGLKSLKTFRKKVAWDKNLLIDVLSDL